MRWALAVAAATLLAVLLYLLVRSGPADPDTAVPAPAPTATETAATADDAGPAALPTAARPAEVVDAGTAPAPPADAAVPVLTLPEPTAPHVAATRHLSNASLAFHEQDFEVAFVQAELALRAMPNRSAARRIAALSACALGRRNDAQRHADHLERSRFVEVQAACARDGVELRMPYAPWP